ncbi:hypothetical protein ACFVJ9_53005, partial [Streptomyces sp. NPDC127574]
GHTCPVCRGADYQPEALAEVRLQELDSLLAAATAGAARRPARHTTRFLRRWSPTASGSGVLRGAHRPTAPARAALPLPRQ